MQDFEKLGAFYLGRPFDLQQKKPKEGLLLYDSKDPVKNGGRSVETTPPPPQILDWADAKPIDLPIEDLESEPQPGAQFAELPPKAAKPKSYATAAAAQAGMGVNTR